MERMASILPSIMPGLVRVAIVADLEVDKVVLEGKLEHFRFHNLYK